MWLYLVMHISAREGTANLKEHENQVAFVGSSENDPTGIANIQLLADAFAAPGDALPVDAFAVPVDTFAVPINTFASPVNAVDRLCVVHVFPFKEFELVRHRYGFAIYSPGGLSTVLVLSLLMGTCTSQPSGGQRISKNSFFQNRAMTSPKRG